MIQIKTFIAKHYIDSQVQIDLDRRVNRFLRQHGVKFVDLKVEPSVTANRESDLVYVLIYRHRRPKELTHHFHPHLHPNKSSHPDIDSTTYFAPDI